MTTKPLDEKRTGLLVRMLGLQSVVCAKAQIEPLLKRGLAQKMGAAYELTQAGRIAAKKVCDEAIAGKRPKMISTYRITAIGSIVGMVETERQFRSKKLASR